MKFAIGNEGLSRNCLIARAGIHERSAAGLRLTATARARAIPSLYNGLPGIEKPPRLDRGGDTIKVKL